MSTRLFYRLACVPLLLLAFGVSGYAQTSPATITQLDAYMAESTAPGGAAITAETSASVELWLTGTNLGYSTNFVVQWTSGNTGLTTTMPTLSAGATTIRVEIPFGLITSADNVTIRIRYNGTEDTNSLPFRVNPPMTEATLPGGTVGIPYSAPLITGGTPPYAVIDSVMPAGYALDPATGNLVGTPGAPGTQTFGLIIRDAWFNTIEPNYLLAIAMAPPVIAASPAAPHGVVSQFYIHAFNATGGVGSPYTWSIASGTLPPGLALNPETGEVTGTPLSPGSSSFTIRVVDSMSGIGTLAVTIPILDVSPTTLPAATAGTAYSQTFTAVGGSAPYSFQFVAFPSGQPSTVPPGLSLSSAGVLSGTPTASGTFNMNLRVADSAGRIFAKAVSIIVNPAPLTITTASPLPGGTVQTPYSLTFAATGGASTLTWMVSSGTLPAGLTLTSNGVLNGIPTTVTTTTFTVQAVTGSPSAASQSATKVFTLSIAESTPTLEVSTATLPDATPGVPYSAVLAATGGEPPYSWSVSGLPAGLTSTTAGAIGGTPTETGTFRVGATVTDAEGRTAGKYLTLVVQAPALTITTVSPLPEARQGIAVNQVFSSTGGVPPYTWGIAGGSVPPGLRFSAGTLSGTPSTTGDFQFIVQLRDSRDTIANKTFNLKVVANTLTVTTRVLPGARVGEPYSAAVEASGGAPPYVWAIAAGAAGLSGDSAGNITGTPTTAGTSTVTAEVTDSRGTKASASFELVITRALLRITTAALPDGTVGSPYSAAFAATGGTPPYQWAAVAGYAAGLALSSEGALSGTPGDPGEYTVYVQVTDGEGLTNTGAFPLRIVPASLTITTASLPGGTVGSAYSAGLSATGNSGPVTWSLSGLPEGVTAGSDGTISGTPGAPGTFSVTVQASDGAGHNATRSLSLVIGLPAIPGVTIVAPETANPAQQPTLQLGLQGTYPLTISGFVTLTFAADGGGDDPTIVFSNGSRAVAFNIPAGTNLATFAVPNLALQTGTVSGTITLRVTLQASGTDITPSPAPTRTIRVNRMPPVITRVTVARTATGFTATVTGYSTTREVSEAIFRFTPAAGTTITSAEVSVPVGSMFTTWYNNPESRAYGSQFTFTQPFTLSGESTSITAVTAILVNAAGRSEGVTATIP